MSDYCTYPLCKRVVSRNGFCFLHAVHFAGEKIKEKPKPISKVSEKRKVSDKEYKGIVKEMLKADPNCEIKEVGCTGKAQGLHHKQKRLPSNLTDRNNLMRACNNCNLWVENNPLEAIEKGFSISKHIKSKA